MIEPQSPTPDRLNLNRLATAQYTVETALANHQNVVLQGPSCSGKTTLLKHLQTALELQSVTMGRVDLSGLTSLGGFKREITHSLQQTKNPWDASTDQLPSGIVVSIDEFGLLKLFTDQTEAQAIRRFVRDNTRVGWIIACNVPLAQIAPEDQDLFPVTVILS